jgi:hypothetical protein
VAEAFARNRYLALLAGGAGTSLFIGCSIAFLRMWGLAFNQSPAALGQAVTTRDSDIYFYLAAASGSLTLLVLFCAAVWPSRRRLRQAEHPRSSRSARPTGAAKPRAAGPARTAAPARAAGAPARPATRLPAGARLSAPASVPQQQAPRPAQPKPPQQKPAKPMRPAQQKPVKQKPVQRSDGRTARR